MQRSFVPIVKRAKKLENSHEMLILVQTRGKIIVSRNGETCTKLSPQKIRDRHEKFRSSYVRIVPRIISYFFF